MKKYGGTRYNSRWDASTWFLILIVVACCIWPIFLDDGLWPAAISFFMLAIMIVLMKSIYYRIDGDQLIVYEFFRPSAFPISKIESVLPTDSILTAPATSVTHRLAIKFNDRNVLKSTTPIIISPVRQDDFVKELLRVNPGIRH